jgi:hypothetical protein
MTSEENTELSRDSSSTKPRRPPSVSTGILILVLLSPFIVGIVAAFIRGALKSAKDVIIAILCLLLLIAVPAYFFIGHRFKWMLPGLVIVFGIAGVWAGLVGRDLFLVGFGITAVLVGVAWNTPSTSTSAFARWITRTKQYLTQDVSKKK